MSHEHDQPMFLRCLECSTWKVCENPEVRLCEDCGKDTIVVYIPHMRYAALWSRFANKARPVVNGWNTFLGAFPQAMKAPMALAILELREFLDGKT